MDPGTAWTYQEKLLSESLTAPTIPGCEPWGMEVNVMIHPHAMHPRDNPCLAS